MVNEKSSPKAQNESVEQAAEPVVELRESTVESVDNVESTQSSIDEIESVMEQSSEPVQEEVESSAEHSDEEAEHSESIDEDIFALKSREELLSLFDRLLQSEPIQTLRRSVESIKITFYKKYRSHVEELKREYIAAGGVEEEFTPPVDELESKLKELLKEYRTRRDKHIADSEAEKEANLQIKLQVIEELKELINSEESIGHTFNKYRELQQRWRDVGLVPHQAVKDLWERYNLHVENFYNYININKELRDLDLKRNYEAKLALCEAAESLLSEESKVEAFRRLQKLHDDWRETGPVALEYKEVLWERFKLASSHINKAHQEHFDSLKDEQLTNLKLKEELCSRVEAMLVGEGSSRKEWNKSSDELLEIQKVWKSIGFAPKKDNNKIYERFRVACDNFFEQKRKFYSSLKDDMTHNLELKTELCLAAEAIQNSEDWKATTQELLDLQAKWKEIGAVSRRHADAIWKRFRAACDAFFERKAKAFSSQEASQGDNLAAKLALLSEMEQADIAALGFDGIKSFQRRWSEIGFVPIKNKEEIAKRYKAVVDSLFTTLRGGEREQKRARFKDRVSNMKSSGDRGVKSERDKLYNKVKQLESEITLLENNIGFFSKSKGAESLIADVEAKINRAKQELKDTIEKVQIIDSQE
ncbi:MAG: DUF349 domain-containing protein [Rikenellaceae bacterium]